MKRHRLLADLIFGIIAILSTVAVWSSSYGAERITILHVNDFHGRLFPYVDKAINPEKPVGGAAYLAAMIKAERERNPEGAVLLSAGDMFQGTPDSNLFFGRPVLDFMNAVRFDAMTLGNHEFDWGREVLDGIIRDARFPILSANIVKPDGKSMTGTRAYVIIRKKGINIAVIGLTTPKIAYMVNAKFVKDLNIMEPESVLAPLIKEVKERGAHLVLLLTHLGFEYDRRLASTMDGIDVIVGGHSHTVVNQPVTVGKTTIVQAGYNGTCLGVLDLLFEKKTGKVTVMAAEHGELRVVSASPGDRFDEDVARMVDTYHEKIRDKFQEVVGETGVDLRRQTDGESNLGNLITDAMRQIAKTEIGLCNNGGMRADIPKGKITMEQIFTVLPFDNVLVTMDMKGADILELLEGNPGIGKGMLQVSGLQITYDLKRPAGSRVMKVLVNGTPLAPAREYRVVTNDFLAAGGDRFVAFRKGKNVVTGVELREAVAEYLRRTSPVNPVTEGRIRLAE